MAKDFFFDLESAKEVLPWLKEKIARLEELGIRGRKAMEEYDIDSADTFTVEIQEILGQIHGKGIILRDLSEILVDFPAVINNMPSYLCWLPEEEGIEYWHYADEGFAGRKRISGNERILSYL
ncbi:hypothetical protein IX51_01190 [uncultured archaeon]|nr:hypothetical protein IX51_01190 [uncultured archaeon]